MKLDEWFDRKLKEYEKDFDFRLETLIYRLTELISEKMREKSISRSDLAQKMEASPAYVTKLMRGNSNFTLRTLLKLADALDQELELTFTHKPNKSNVIQFGRRPWAYTDSVMSSIKASKESAVSTTQSTDYASDGPIPAVGGGGY